ncbi:Ig-like domain-containing protein, partial [Methanobacterium sp.]
MTRLNKKLSILILSSIFALIICGTTAGADLNQNYTNNSDFDNGTLVNLEHETVNDQLQLSNSSDSTFSYIWVPNSNDGTVSKLNTLTGKELGRYKVCPDNVSTYANPSRTTVDLVGNCWVGNRQIGTAVKIGLYENGQYQDRNGNGFIETSRDRDGNGVIDADEILPWGQDECVFYEVILIPEHEGTYIPGNYIGIYANNYNNPGPRGLAVDSKNNVWIGTFGTKLYYYINGSTGEILKCINITSTGHTPYGAVIDGNGILWSSGNNGNNVLRLDPSNDSFIKINLPHMAYGLALDQNNHLFVSGLNFLKTSCINTLTGEILWTKDASYGQGIAVTPDGDIWTANNVYNSVSRFSNDGTLKITIPVGNTPTGVAVDREGKVWVVDVGDEFIHRINPTTNQVELSKRIPGSLHYGYSDMTGLVSSTITTSRGSWTVIHDSGITDAPWGIISWNSSQPTGTSVKVRVHSSNDQNYWSAWESVTSGVNLVSTPPGRYLQVETTLERLQGSVSPILYDLTVGVPLADLSISLNADNIHPEKGKEVVLTLTANNHGPSDSRDVSVSFRLPKGLHFVSSEGGSYDSSRGLWNIGNLASGSTNSLIIHAIMEMGGSLFGGALISGREQDPLISNNLALLGISTRALTPPLVNPNPSLPVISPPSVLQPDTSQITVNAASNNVYSPLRKNTSNSVPMENTGMSFSFLEMAMLLVFLGAYIRKKGLGMFKNPYLLIPMAFIVTMVLCGAVGAADNTTNLVSVPFDGGTDDYSRSDEPVISADGRYVAFTSSSSHLVPGENNYYQDIFVRDLQTQITERVSVSNNGAEGNGDSSQPNISADGRYVVFTSYASNLVLGDNNSCQDIFIRDRLSGTTQIITKSFEGGGTIDQSFDPSINADGRYVVFTSYASNLVPNDVNERADIFLWDRATSSISRVSVTPSGGEANGDSSQPSISADGRYLVFSSSADNLVSSDTNGNQDIFLRDLASGITQRISLGPNGEESGGHSDSPFISGDGRFVTFCSGPLIFDPDDEGGNRIYVYDRISGALEKIKLPGALRNLDEYEPSLSADGRYVAFTCGRQWQSAAWAYDPVTGTFGWIGPGNEPDYYKYRIVMLYDRQLKTLTPVSLSISGKWPNDDSEEPSISADGRIVVFSSQADNLIPGSPSGVNVFVRGSDTILPGLQGKITPNPTTSGTVTTITAYTTPGILSVTAEVQEVTSPLIKQSDGRWIAPYTVPSLADGVYPVILKAFDGENHESNTTIFLTVDNTPPSITGVISPSKVYIGGANSFETTFTLSATTVGDANSATADLLGTTVGLYGYSANQWHFRGDLNIDDEGVFPVVLTARDRAGNTGTCTLNLTSQRSSPTINAWLNETLVEPGDVIRVTVTSDPDAEWVRVLAPEETFMPTKNGIGEWVYDYVVPSIADGDYSMRVYLRYGLGLNGRGYSYFVGQSVNLPFRVDTPPTLTGNLTPSTGQKGDLITINAKTELDVEKVSVHVLNESFNLTKQAGGKWTRNYVIPRVLDGSYPVTLTASDRSGYITTIQLLLTVDSAEPTIVGNLTPTLVRSGSTVNLTAQTDPETVKVTAQLLGDNIPLTKQADGTWKSTYNIPPTTDGKHTVYFIAEDTGGNQGTDCQTFTVDNTPPTISGSLTPNGLYAGENIDVDAYTSNDAKTVTASFGSEQKTLHDTSTAAWSASYTTTTTTTTGEYQMNLQTSDALGNTATMTLPYTIYPTGEPNTPTQPTTPETTGNPTPGTSQENSPSSSSQIQPSSTSQSFGSAKKSDSSTSSNKSENGSESKDEGSKNERSQSNLDFIKFLLEMILFILAAAEMIFAIYIIYYLILALILAGGGPFA